MIDNQETGRMTVIRPTSSAGTVHEHHDVHGHPFAHLADWRVHWGPIFAGLLTALTTLTVLGLLGAAVGLTAFNNGVAAAQAGGPAPELGRNAAAWGAISVAIAFLLGGYVASRVAGLIDPTAGAWHGLLTFMLAVPVFMWLASRGLGAMVGGLSDYAATYGPGYVPDGVRATNPGDVARVAAAARNAAWGAFASVIVGLGASAIGGYLGSHRHLVHDREHHDVHAHS